MGVGNALRGARAAVCVLALPLLATAPAVAAPTDSPLLIRSLSPVLGSDPGAEYVMLQMSLDGQDLAGETLAFYGPGGGPSASHVLAEDDLVGEAQRTVLIATPGAAARPDFPPPDVALPAADSLSPLAGAVCITGRYPADCAAWGAFPAVAAAGLPDPPEHPAAVIAGEALGRWIDRGCVGWLDPDDDIGPVLADFFDGVSPGLIEEPAPPSPRNNSQQVFGAPCQLDTAIDILPANPTNRTTATFAFGEIPREYGATFQCRHGAAPLPAAGQLPFQVCPRRGLEIPDLADGTYELEVFAGGQVGPDPTPASWTWEVDTVPPDTAIDAVPPEPSSGFSASFGFHSSEPHSRFQCQYESGPIQACEPGKTIFSLADGRHAFRVWAIDQATNVDPTPAVATFTVDTSLGDRSPPDTTILARPANPSSRAQAAFAYRANESRVSFQCRLDEAPFRPCDPTGVAYSRLRNGAHSFAVRAVDRAGNLDPFPATYAWSVRAPLPETLITSSPPGAQRIPRGATNLMVRFGFRSAEPGTRFRCRLDKRKFSGCRSPAKLSAAVGRHRFEVYAIDPLGNAETTPARRIFRVLPAGRDDGLFRTAVAWRR